MLNRLKNKNQGFTIIEVMIVLAIAGLIILIVLLAVPALQRNGRNTAIKNDASAVTAAVGEYESNNDGALPARTGVLTSNGVATICDANPCTKAQSTAKVQSTTVVNGLAGVASAPAVPLTVGNIYVVYGAKCNNGSSYTATTDLASSTRSTAVLYPIEQNSGNPSGKCIDS